MTLNKTRVPVHVSPYFVAMAALCFAAGSAAKICLGLGFAALHECGHLAALTVWRERPARVCLTAAGMRIERPPGLYLSYEREIGVALAGPAVSLALAGLFGLLRLQDCLWLNLGFGLLNLLPVRQLDGGRALYYALCRRVREQTARRTVLVCSLLCLFCAALPAALLSLRAGLQPGPVVLVIYLALCC